MTEEWAHAFLVRFDLVNWGLPGKLITNCEPKFFSIFWIVLFEKLKVKLLYSIAYYPQMDKSSEMTNQTVEIVLRFFVYALNNSGPWP